MLFTGKTTLLFNDGDNYRNNHLRAYNIQPLNAVFIKCFGEHVVRCYLATDWSHILGGHLLITQYLNFPLAEVPLLTLQICLST